MGVASRPNVTYSTRPAASATPPATDLASYSDMDPMSRREFNDDYSTTLSLQCLVLKLLVRLLSWTYISTRPYRKQLSFPSGKLLSPTHMKNRGGGGRGEERREERRKMCDE